MLFFLKMDNKLRYVNIQEWMLDFDLTQTELICLAIIFGFSHDGTSNFSGSASYLSKWCMVKNKKTIYEALKRLSDKKIIIKHENNVNGIKLCYYSFNFDILSNPLPVQNLHHPSVNFTPPPSVNFTHHNIDKDNIEDNNNCVAEEIYNLYPRKVSKKMALIAIEKALKKYDAEFIKNKTMMYAELSSWKSKEYIPHPSTWFNQERFNDNPEEWKQPTQGFKNKNQISEQGKHTLETINNKSNREKSNLEDDAF